MRCSEQKSHLQPGGNGRKLKEFRSSAPTTNMMRMIKTPLPGRVLIQLILRQMPLSTKPKNLRMGLVERHLKALLVPLPLPWAGTPLFKQTCFKSSQKFKKKKNPLFNGFQNYPRSLVLMIFDAYKKEL